MKRFSIWLLSILTLLLGFTSCELNEEFQDCPEIDITIENEPGSAVYRFVAQFDGAEDARFTWTIDGEEIATGTINDVIGQILDYKFENGTHTVCVKVADENCPIQVCKDIVVERDENDPCPDLFFDSRPYERPNTYKFIADFKEIQEVTYEWFINGEYVEASSPDERNYLIWDFNEPGKYEVCIKTETPDCPSGTSYCKEIIVKESDLACPEVSFSKEMEPGTVGTYVFEANIERVDEVSEIAWFVNGDLIENPADPQNGNRVLVYQFESGAYEVCLKVTTPDCPDGVKYCKEIRVGDCPELSFEPERDGDNPAYYFYPRYFDGIEDYPLSWFVNGEFVGTTKSHDEPFYYQFDPGTYEVCSALETPDCPQGIEFCKTIEITGPTQ